MKMDNHDQPLSTLRVVLTDEELGIPAIEDLCNKYFDWLRLSKESGGGRKTRSANKRADTIFDEIVAFKLPQIEIKQPVPQPTTPVKSNSTKSSVDGESLSSNPTSRTLRPRSRTPQPTPSTPKQQSIRAHMKKNPDSGSSVLTAALNQQHPSVSVTKIRQLLRADSAQKKREEERERQEKLRQERKLKEERAEAQKRQMLEERATTAKLKREQRLMHAAEVRKAREKQKVVQKLKDVSMKTPRLSPEVQIVHEEIPQKVVEPVVEKPVQPAAAVAVAAAPKPKLDETFKKPQEQNNIDISVHDETTDSHGKPKPNLVAFWAKAPHLRDAVIAQFSKPEAELLKEAFIIFMGEKLKKPVDLAEIFGPSKKYLCRTSSAVWSPPNRALKRASSMVMTPTNETKR